MSVTVRIEVNRGGIGEVARSDRLRADLERRARAVQAAANSPDTWEDTPVPLRVESSTGRTRARARVIADHPGALPLEARYRFLGRALDAAGG